MKQLPPPIQKEEIMKPSVRDVVARAMYEVENPRMPWDHPDTVKFVQPIMKRRATKIIAAYNRAVRTTYTQKGRK
jgi:hypothetical protein